MFHLHMVIVKQQDGDIKKGGVTKGGITGTQIYN
jgi:hypothetical protein